MDNIEDMKTLWKELDNRISFLEEENRKLARSVKENKLSSARENLIRKYRMFIILECIMIIWVILFVSHNPMVIEKYKLATTIYWSVFFLIEMGLDLFLLIKTKAINIYDSPVTEIVKRAATNWKTHKIGIAIGIPLAIGAVILFALALDANEFAVLGIITGAIVGVIIGIKQLLKFREYYRQFESSEY